MSGKSQDLHSIEDEEFAADPEEQHIEAALEPAKLANANDARKRLEDYWEQKALEEELKRIDDWDDADSPS